MNKQPCLELVSTIAGSLNTLLLEKLCVPLEMGKQFGDGGHCFQTIDYALLYEVDCSSKLNALFLESARLNLHQLQLSQPIYSEQQVT